MFSNLIKIEFELFNLEVNKLFYFEIIGVYIFYFFYRRMIRFVMKKKIYI